MVCYAIFYTKIVDLSIGAVYICATLACLLLLLPFQIFMMEHTVMTDACYEWGAVHGCAAKCAGHCGCDLIGGGAAGADGEDCWA